MNTDVKPRRWTRKRQLVLGGLIIATGSAMIWREKLWGEPSAGMKRSRPAPEFNLTTIDGKKISSEDFKDQTTVVHFWASWCAPCIPELPEILGAAAKLQKDAEGRPIRFVLISIDETWDKARAILDPAKLPANTVALLDPDAKVAEAFGTFQYPETYVLTRGRVVAAKWIGPQEWSGDWGVQALQGIETVSRTSMSPGAGR